MKTILAKKWILLLLVATVMGSGCVSYRKYEDLETWKNRLVRQNEELTSSLEASRAEANRLRTQLQEAQQQSQTLGADLATARQRYDELDRSNRDLLDRYDRILAQNQQMLQNTSSEKQQLTNQLILKEQELTRRERELESAQSELARQTAALATLREELAAREAKVNELQRAIDEKEAVLRTLRETINQALRGFSASDLSVREENGKLYVSLSQNLLFRSGSKTINQEGKNALARLAQVLNTSPDINITVEGHTDSDGDDLLNWNLSVGRAITVLSELTSNGVDPRRITAAGRGEYYPVAENTSADGKARNRRTEIILTPKLDALYDIIGQ